MATFGNAVRFDALRILGFASITGAFTAFGVPFVHRVRIVKFTNTTDADLLISFDGITQNDIVSAGGFALYDISTNNAPTDNYFVFSQGTQPFVQALTAPTKGGMYLTLVYAKGD